MILKGWKRMDINELLEYLDIEEPSQFEYFEAMADLAESEEYMDPETLFPLFDGADGETVARLTEDYFKDILEGLPENSGEIFSLLHQIKLALTGLIANSGDESDIRRFAEEFSRFRNWYSITSDVELVSEETGERLHHSLRDAVTASRLEKLGGEKYRYDFENALEYELDGYTVSVAELMAAEDENRGTIVFDPEEDREEE